MEFFYKRNHGPVPIVEDIDKSDNALYPFVQFSHVKKLCDFVFDSEFVWFDLSRYSVSVTGLIENPKELYMKDIL